jgi:hypothetical protein
MLRKTTPTKTKYKDLFPSVYTILVKSEWWNAATKTKRKRKTYAIVSRLNSQN